MIKLFHTTEDSRLFRVFCITLCGWLEFVMARSVIFVQETSLDFTTVLIFSVFGIGFVASAWAVRRQVLRYHQHLVKFLMALLWILSLIISVTSGALVASIVVIIAAYPLFYFFLQELPLLSQRNKPMLATVWIGGFVLCLVLVVIQGLVKSPLIVTLGLVPAELAMLWTHHHPYSAKPSAKITMPTRMLYLGTALLFLFGVATSAAIPRIPLSSPLLAFTIALVTGTAGLLLLLAKRIRWLAYAGALFMDTGLVQWQHPFIASDVIASILMQVAGYLFILWWAGILLAWIRQGSWYLGMGLGLGCIAYSIGWLIQLPLSQPMSNDAAFLIIILLTGLIPVITMGNSNSAGTRQVTFVPPNPNAFYAHTKLTQQERKIVDLLLGGSSNQDIIKHLYISINTLKTHLRNIYRKTETKNRRELIDLIRQYQVYSMGE